MTSQKSRNPKSAAASRKSDGDKDKHEPEFLPPLKPKKGLFILFGVLLLIWLIILIVMRVKTVKNSPRQGDQPATVIGALESSAHLALRSAHA